MEEYEFNFSVNIVAAGKDPEVMSWDLKIIEPPGVEYVELYMFNNGEWIDPVDWLPSDRVNQVVARMFAGRLYPGWLGEVVPLAQEGGYTDRHQLEIRSEVFPKLDGAEVSFYFWDGVIGHYDGCIVAVETPEGFYFQRMLAAGVYPDSDDVSLATRAYLTIITESPEEREARKVLAGGK